MMTCYLIISFFSVVSGHVLFCFSCARVIPCNVSACLLISAKSSSGWSMWRPVSGKKTEIPGGIYLDDLASIEDPEMAKIYLGRPR